MGRSRRAGLVTLPTDIVVGPWAGEEWKLSKVDMGMVGSVAMGLPWKGRGRGSVCWVGSVSGCWVLPWKGRGRGSVCWVGSLGLAMERKRQRIGLLGWIVGSCREKEMAENRPVGCYHGKEEAENRAKEKAEKSS